MSAAYKGFKDMMTGYHEGRGKKCCTRRSIGVAGSEENECKLNLTQQINHLNRGDGGFCTLVARFRACALDGLLDGVGRDDAEDDGDARAFRDAGDAACHAACHIIEVSRCTANNGTEANDRVEAAALGQDRKST